MPSSPQHTLLLKTLLLLLQLYYDLNAQDLPPFFEDRLTDVMPLLLKYLDYSPFPIPAPSADDDDDDETEEAGDLEKLKAEVCEIATLYSQRYLDAFAGEGTDGGFMGRFVASTWGLLTKLGKGVKYDIVRPTLLPRMAAG